VPAKQVVLTPLGLILQPNDVGQYPPGALKVARNVHMRDPGLLRPFPDQATYQANAASANREFRRLFPTATQLLGAALNPADTSQCELRWVTAVGTTLVSTPELAAFTFDAHSTRALAHRGRYYVLSSQGVLAFASEGAASAYLAGFVAPRCIDFVSRTPDDGQAIPADSTAAYRAIFVRKGSDGSYIKISPPSHALRVYSTGVGTVNIQLRVSWSDAVSDNLLAGDVLELYRTEKQDEDVDPGDTFYLAKAVELSSTNLTNAYVDVLDTTSDAGLGVELYTNPGQPYGALAAKHPPPRCTDVCWYKGHAFYVATALPGYNKLRIPGAWGRLDTDAERTHGIGRRQYTATSTATSNVLTGLSSTDNLELGMDVEMAGVPANTTILSVDTGAATVTMSNAASGSGTGTASFYDKIMFSGVGHGGLSVRAETPALFAKAIPQTEALQLTFDQTLDADPDVEHFGVEVILSQPWYAYGTGSTVPSLRATNGQNYSPELPALNETAVPSSHDVRLNRLRIAEKDQPEAVALTAGSELLVGQGTLHRVVATTDAVWAFCSDGLHRISGVYPDWNVDPVDPTLVLAARNAVDVMQGVVWAYTNRGLVAITDAGVQEVSEGILGGPTGLLPGAVYQETQDITVSCDEANREVHVFFPVTDGSYSVVFNTKRKAFTTCTFAPDSGTIRTLAYAPYLRSSVWGLLRDVMRHATTSVGMDNCAVSFQPVVGVDPFTLCRWIDCQYRFGFAVPFAITPTFSEIEFPSGFELVASVANEPLLAPVPVELNGGSAQVSISLEPVILPGFTIATGEGQLWSFRGLALRYAPASERIAR
jgi:hypothetical protein